MAAAPDSVRALVQILAERGPLPEEDVVQRLQSAGATDVEFDHLLDEVGSAADELVDGRWVWLPTLLAGRVFTHRVSTEELAHDMLTVTPDLDPVTTLCENDEYARFADGSHAHVALPDYDLDLLDRRGIPLESLDPLGALLLPGGTLAARGVVEGDLIGVRLTPEGLAIERVAADTDASLAPRLAAVLHAAEPVYFNAAVWTVCAEDPTLFARPLLPVSEIADDSGLTRRDEWLAPAEFDFGRWEFDRGIERLIRRHRIEPDEALAVYTLVQLFESTSLLMELAGDDELDDALDVPEGGELADLQRDVGAALVDPLLAEILLTETVGTSRTGAAALGLFAETMEQNVPRAAQVAYRWLRGVALERLGHIDDAEQAFQSAESLNTDWAPALFDLARFAADRGDAERALSLLRRADVPPDDAMVSLLERHRARPRTDLGRNDACWCGSGRKYKKCHLCREQLGLSERADWLYAKAVQHTVQAGWSDLLLEAALERTRYTDEELAAGMGDPLVVDAVLVEGGAFEEFLEMRGSLLPEDERLLAEQWVSVNRSVFEVERVQRGRSVSVRDVRTGVRSDVQEMAASRQLTSGQLICARVLPVGDTEQFFGGVEPVALHERDALIECLDAQPDPVTVVAQLSRRFAPPVMTNTEGDPLVIRDATLRVTDPDAIKTLLDDAYDRVAGEQPPQWMEHVATHGMNRIRATLVLDGDTIEVNTNSDERMDRVQATLIRLDPAIAVLEDTRRPIRSPRDAEALANQVPGGGAALDPNDPEVAAILDEVIGQYEANWLDEPIPALGGSTPRDAADDPTRRDDLIRLLATFPVGETGRGGMDADRLRVALGLPIPPR